MNAFQIVSLLVNLFFLFLVLYSVHQQKLREAYALVWLLTSVFMIVFSAFTPALSFFAHLFQIKTPAFALLSCLIMGILFFLFQITVVISEHNRKISRLTQEITLLREELERKK